MNNLTIKTIGTQYFLWYIKIKYANRFHVLFAYYTYIVYYLIIRKKSVGVKVTVEIERSSLQSEQKRRNILHDFPHCYSKYSMRT